MWAYILRKLLYNIPVYIGIILLVMIALRVNDPVYAYLGKNATAEQINTQREQMGLTDPFVVQYVRFVANIFTLNFQERSWEQQRPVGTMIRDAIGPSMAITLPALAITATLSITVGLISSFFRGRALDRILMILAVLGMSISFLVYIIIGQYFGTYWLKNQFGLDVFAIEGYESWITWGSMKLGSIGLPYPAALHPEHWVRYCMLPVLISVVVAMGYDTRFYRAVMVEEGGRDYIVTAQAKGATKRKIMFVHMLKNAMIPVITRVMITLPFLITGNILLETFFGIPGMGRTLINAIMAKDFPVIQAFTAVFAALFILTNILTDVLYALVDPRVRLS